MIHNGRGIWLPLIQGQEVRLEWARPDGKGEAFLFRERAQLGFLVQSVTAEKGTGPLSYSPPLGIRPRMRNLYKESVLVSSAFLSSLLTRQISQLSEQTIHYCHSLYNKYVFWK